MAARIHDLLDRSLEQGANAPFIVLPGRSLSFADIARLSDQAEAELRALNVRAGDRVMVVAENCPEHAALIFACSRIGAWSCGVNARMAPAEIEAFDQRADARVIYFTASASRSAQAHATRFHAMPSRLPGMAHSAVRADSIPETGPLQEEVASLIFTSGTTGHPKGVMLRHDALCHFAQQSAQSRALSPDDRCYAFVPMTHIFGLATVMLTALQARAQLVMRPQFDPADLLDALAHHGVSQLQGPPALYSRLLAYLQEQGIERIHAPALRFVYTGAGPLDLSLKQRVEAAFGQPLYHGYG
ncbi:MAG: long-chain fatty acid--CoA ligase, partial [Brachymonas sp.]|nr:long-chain fatty acid--CoA ligase [Brachymonas sp.]